MSARWRWMRNLASSLRSSSRSRAGQVGGKFAEAVVEQPDERLPGAIVSVVRGRGEQQQVAGLVVGEPAQQRVALVRLRGSDGRRRRDARVWASSTITSSGHSSGEFVAAAALFDVVGGDDQVRVVLVDGRAERHAAGQPVRRRGQQHLGVDAELVCAARPATAARAGASTAPPAAAASPHARSSAAISPASIVLPMPTPSAISSRVVSWDAAIISGTS